MFTTVQKCYLLTGAKPILKCVASWNLTLELDKGDPFDLVILFNQNLHLSWDRVFVKVPLYFTKRLKFKLNKMQYPVKHKTFINNQKTLKTEFWLFSYIIDRCTGCTSVCFANYCKNAIVTRFGIGVDHIWLVGDQDFFIYP